jgi:hypothetical protein
LGDISYLIKEFGFVIENKEQVNSSVSGSLNSMVSHILGKNSGGSVNSANSIGLKFGQELRNLGASNSPIVRNESSKNRAHSVVSMNQHNQAFSSAV